MRAAILPVLALAAATFATPSFAAPMIGQPGIKACKKQADARGVTGRARGEAVQECMEPSKKPMKRAKSTKKHTMG